MARNKIEYEGITYNAVEWNGRGRQCDSCDIERLGICDAAWCSGYERIDGKNVVFVMED